MKDFRVVQAKTALLVNSIVPIRGFEPPSVLIAGEKMNLAEEIYFNNIQVTEYMILGPTRILAKIPDSQVGKSLTSLSVLCAVSAATKDTTLSFGITKPIKTVSGIDRLVQEWALTFLSTPGSDIFDPSAGGGASAIVGRTLDPSTASAALAQAVERTRKQIIEKQSNVSGIPPSERLLSAEVSSIKYDRETTTLSAIVELRNMVGSSALVTVG